jgi:hypothetical protein
MISKLSLVIEFIGIYVDGIFFYTPLFIDVLFFFDIFVIEGACFDSDLL